MSKSESIDSTAKFSFDFMGKRHWGTTLSAILVVVSIITMAIDGLSLGLDFTGGSQLEVGFEQPVQLSTVREVLQEQRFEGAVPVFFGPETEVSIRFPGSLEDVATRQINANIAQLTGAADTVVSKTELGTGEYQSILTISGPNAQALVAQKEQLFPRSNFGKVAAERGNDNTALFSLEKNISEAPKQPLMDALSAATGSVASLVKSDTVGAQVGDELYESAVIGGLLSLGLILVYIALRFQYKFAIGAVVCLAHDVLIVLCLFAVFQWEFDLTVFAAILATIGYSLNDTIVVFDRIRENFRKMRKGTPFEIINLSLNQTFERTMMTSLTTLLVLVCLFIFGGESIHYFSLALILGITVGTYSSIYVAANITYALNITKEDLAVPVKEGANMDGVV